MQPFVCACWYCVTWPHPAIAHQVSFHPSRALLYIAYGSDPGANIMIDTPYQYLLEILSEESFQESTTYISAVIHRVTTLATKSSLPAVRLQPWSFRAVFKLPAYHPQESLRQYQPVTTPRRTVKSVLGRLVLARGFK